MTPPTIIALSGLSGAGKSTVAEALQALIHATHRTCDIQPFAKQVKYFAGELGWRGGKEPKDRALLEGLTVLREEFAPGWWSRDWARMRRLDQDFGRRIIIAPDRGWRFTLERDLAKPPEVPLRRLERHYAPKHYTLYKWDEAARNRGILIDNNAPDHGAAAAAEIWRQVKQRMETNQ